MSRSFRFLVLVLGGASHFVKVYLSVLERHFLRFLTNYIQTGTLVTPVSQFVLVSGQIWVRSCEWLDLGDVVDGFTVHGFLCLTLASTLFEERTGTIKSRSGLQG